MEQLNKIELKGIVGSVKTQQIADYAVTRFTLCTNTQYTNAEGITIDTMWHNVVWYDHDAEKVIKTGDKLHVIGRIRHNRIVDVNGVPVFSTEIVANKVNLITTELKAERK